MPKNIVKVMDDNRAFSDIGTAIFVRRAGAEKYALWLLVSDMPATGSAPEQIEKTVSTSNVKNYTFGRKDNSQKEFTFMAHRDNFRILKGDYNKKLDFLQINPDGTGWKFQGYVSFYQDATSLGNNVTGKGVITVSKSEELPVDDVTDIIQETVTFNSAIPAVVDITGTGTEEILIETDPADATVTVKSETEGVATASYSSNKVTITGVSNGSAIIEIKATKADCADGVTYVLAKVEGNA